MTNLRQGHDSFRTQEYNGMTANDIDDPNANYTLHLPVRYRWDWRERWVTYKSNQLVQEHTLNTPNQAGETTSEPEKPDE